MLEQIKQEYDLQGNSFQERFPWIGGDLQTIRDTLCVDLSRQTDVDRFYIPIEKIPLSNDKKDFLLGYLQVPPNNNFIKALVLITHGLGGSTKRFGLKRVSKKLLNDGFAIIKLNLRGAGSGRYLSDSNYSARCSEDIIATVNFIKENLICKDKRFLNLKHIPVLGLGLSLGGSILLNACCDYEENEKLFDGIACVSTPVDLKSSSQCIEKRRNFIYQKWLINKLKQQLLDTVIDKKNSFLVNKIKKVKSIREFDENFTAPSWGYKSVEEYYLKASPIFQITKNLKKMPPTILIHSKDDPWVPYRSTLRLKQIIGENNSFRFLFTEKGGHNGFHSPNGCWSDDVVKNWFNNLT